MTTVSLISYDYPKAPRWINTEAGHLAWAQFAIWRGRAANALSVQERQQLLAEAEQLFGAAQLTEAHAKELAA